MRGPGSSLAAAILLAGCGGGGRAEPRIRVEEPSRLDLLTRVPPVVHAVVDGRPGLPFLLDSGASVTSLDLGRAQALGLRLRSSSRPGTTRGSDGRTVPLERYAVLGRLELGAVLVEGLAVPVIESEATAVPGWFGILGQDVLARFPVVLDAERGHVHFLPPSTDEGSVRRYLEEAKLGKGKWAVAPAPFRPSPFLAFDVAGLEPGTIELEIDTGSTATSLPQAAIRALGLEPVGTFESRTIAGTERGETYLVRGMDLFGLKVTAEVGESRLEYGLLGMDVLRELVLVLDGPGGKIWLHKREEEAEGR
ncbi:MAG: retropepsin-like aspartic protease [Planctomycetota bacterium]